MSARKRRGADTQRIVAEYFRDNGYPFAESTGAGRSGSDLTGTPGLAVEIKARADFEPLAWLKQAEKGATHIDLPCVIWRPNGYGPTTINQWPVMLRLEQFTELIREAGY